MSVTEVLEQARWCSVGGVRTRYRAAGEAGQAVVLLHGIGRALEDWSETVDALAAGHRVYAPDLVGFGYTDKPRGALYAPRAWRAL